MKRWMGGVMAVGLLAVALQGQAAPQADWAAMRQAQSRDDIATWSRPVEGMAVKAFKGQTEVPVTAWAVLALLADTDSLAAWVFQGKQSTHPEGTPADQAYLRFKGVWPADDRDVLIRTTVRQQADGRILVDSREVAGWPQQGCCVRIPLLKNTFTLTPLPGRWTRVEFQTQIDLGGLVPSWLANAVSTEAPLKTLQGLRKLVVKPAYQISSPTQLPTQYHPGGVFTLPEAHLQAASP